MRPAIPKPDNFKPCSWHVRLGIAGYCSTDCLKWRQEVDIRTLGDIAALDISQERAQRWPASVQDKSDE